MSPYCTDSVLGGTMVAEQLSEASRRLRAEQAARRGRQFVKGPIPTRWLERAAALPGKAFTVGVVLWFRRGIEGDAFTVSQKTLSRFHVGRKAAARAYALLSEAGLIEVERHAGRLPRVKVLVASG